MSEQNESKNHKNDSVLEMNIAQILISEPAVTDTEVAKRLNISRSTVNRKRNAPEVQKIIKEQFLINSEKINKLLFKALAVVDRSLESSDSKEALTAAVTMLRIFGETLSLQLKSNPEDNKLVYVAKWGGLNEDIKSKT